MINAAPALPARTQRIVAGIILGITTLQLIPIVFALRHLERIFFHPQSAGPIAGALFVAGAYVVFSLRNSDIRRHVAHLSWLRFPAIALALTAGLVEEIYFRQILMNAMQAAGAHVALQIVVSAVAFGAGHAIWGLAGGGWRVARGAVLATTLLGFALAILYVAAGRVILPCILAHFLIDLVLEPALMIFAVENSRRAATARECRPVAGRAA